ncbi:hypothetical protein IL308_05815 [Lactococcus lactis]|uniref:hypothetical protein n=1 Tax=Lactococcus lactis TaxID=1358 RepID=UPI001911E8D9|nr:hypothetical protein [Lactococcus lactis]MBK5076308.1 hypothetical protein [Lactococcus lactis]
MRLLESEPDEFIQATVEFMLKLDKHRREEVFSYARYTHHQKELERNNNQHLQIVKSGGTP